jgi:hypothetical protein
VSEPRWQNPTSKKGWVRIGHDRALWIPCLPKFPDRYDRGSWAAECARLWWDASGLEHGKPEITQLTARLSAIHERTYGHIPCHQAFIHLPDPRLMPLTAYLGIWEPAGETDAQLRLLTHAGDTDAVEPPIIEEFRTPKLGSGLRTLLYKQLEDGSLAAVLSYAWRSEQHATDLQLWSPCNDLGRLQRAIADIDGFARAITIIPRSELHRG